MSDGELAKLIRMANQIATFFDSQKQDAAEEVAHHILAFWSPRMCERIVVYLRSGGTGLNETAARAVLSLPSRPLRRTI